MSGKKRNRLSPGTAYLKLRLDRQFIWILPLLKGCEADGSAGPSNRIPATHSGFPTSRAQGRSGYADGNSDKSEMNGKAGVSASMNSENREHLFPTREGGYRCAVKKQCRQKNRQCKRCQSGYRQSQRAAHAKRSGNKDDQDRDEQGNAQCFPFGGLDGCAPAQGRSSRGS